ncbi:hypothetical protein CNMCM5793_000514 [Aspergillus hiratsukae]|uniref:Alanyl-transfer RNA synthetases family profile domain-containing protein n=1 Tax=Aspergillus hiratsukae TaxID=1194566 RepID=A0A8H6UG43_9EURO|nr:hypothetical protein CNMCM5793_000514 [Aspergillus hiratsukae]KAF7156965.1 hypothetical protein CNMCM6106_001744 [Aspergillus hiratsukae]
MTSVRTLLTFQHNAKLHNLQTTVRAIHPFPALEDSNRQLFKQGTDADYAVITEQTIFHPQGGGQPSDEGTMTSASGVTFTVAAVRMDAVREGQVLHFGRFNASSSSIVFSEGETVEQAIDADKRLLYSRLHTAGHVLGAAVRHLLEKEVQGFDELKASHFPDAAACEFQGVIDGKWKEPIQEKVNEFIAAKLPVEVEWWDEEEFRRRGLERLLPDRDVVAVAPGEKFRVVNIVGAEVYPCGGTHVDTTDLCGLTTVRKITRKAGKSKVSYTVAD